MNMAAYWTAIVHGLIQGLTEVFPISSSGHLVLLSATLGLPRVEVNTAVLLHIGSLVAITAFYGRDAVQAFLGRWGRRLPLGILLAGALTAAIALPLQRQGLDTIFGNQRLVIGLLLVNGTVLWVAGRAVGDPVRANTSLSDLQWRDFVVLGILQGVAALPGISRLGFTVLAGLRAGLRWQDALRLSFVLGIPTIAGAGFFELGGAGETFMLTMPLLVGLVVAMLGTALALVILRLRAFERRFLTYFGFYCLAFSVFCLVLLTAG